MQDYIKTHKKQAIIVLILLIIGAIFAITTTSNILINPSNNDEIIEGIDLENPDGYGFVAYSTSLYSLDYNESPVDGVPKENNIKINAYTGYISAAARVIYDMGINPVGYKITYFKESPFKKYEQ